VGGQKPLVTLDEFVNKIGERVKCSLFKKAIKKKRKRKGKC
jgi:ribosome maturation factor RimP